MRLWSCASCVSLSDTRPARRRRGDAVDSRGRALRPASASDVGERSRRKRDERRAPRSFGSDAARTYQRPARREPLERGLRAEGTFSERLDLEVGQGLADERTHGFFAFIGSDLMKTEHRLRGVAPPVVGCSRIQRPTGTPPQHLGCRSGAVLGTTTRMQNRVPSVHRHTSSTAFRLILD